MHTTQRATVEDLYHVPENGKAEIVNGELVRMSPTGGKPGRAEFDIAISLRMHEERYGGGHALPDNVGFTVDLPDRQSFSPDTAWYIGDIDDMEFLLGAPIFAVNVRSKSDYGPQADRDISKKIADYFAAGTRVVWDVDLLGENIISAYQSDTPTTPILYQRGDLAHAEPAVPGWTFAVDALFTLGRR